MCIRDSFGDALLALRQALAHAHDDFQAGFQSGFGALVHGLVGLGKVLTALGVCILYTSIPNHKIDLNIGIMKAYSSCVGEGPFTCALFGEEAEKLRRAGGEYGAATGRPRRVGCLLYTSRCV